MTRAIGGGPFGRQMSRLRKQPRVSVKRDGLVGAETLCSFLTIFESREHRNQQMLSSGREWGSRIMVPARVICKAGTQPRDPLSSKK